jgi:hypothetical protein
MGALPWKKGRPAGASSHSGCAEGVVVENGRVRMPADPAAALDAAVWGPG